MVRTEQDNTAANVEGALEAIEFLIQLTDADKAIGDPDATLRKYYLSNQTD